MYEVELTNVITFVVLTEMLRMKNDLLENESIAYANKTPLAPLIRGVKTNPPDKGEGSKGTRGLTDSDKLIELYKELLAMFLDIALIDSK